MDITAEIKYYGKKDLLPRQKVLHAGNLSVVYEAGNLRYFTCNDTEIIRMIYSAVRDKDWLTVIPEITDEIIDDKYDSFHISYNCRYKLNDLDFKANYQINGKADGTITFEMRGQALSTFLRNRIGFCVLHPVKYCAGADCRIVHPGGSIEVKPFPEYINPDDIFKDVQSMKWQIQERLYAAINFYGDIFETEDHRNWTDASFKTYCTPLEIPYPVKVEKGTVISQKIELTISGRANDIKSTDSVINILLKPCMVTTFPSLGIGRSSRDLKLTAENISLLGKLHFGHYRTDLYLFNPNWKKVYLEAAKESQLLNSPLELALFFGDNHKKEAELFFSTYSEYYSSIKSVFLFNKGTKATTNELIENIAGLIRQNIPEAKLYAGTNCNFAQLNRSRPKTSLIDGLVFGIHPQEHASDNLTLAENLQAQAYTIESAKQFADGKEIAISPVTIQRRFNANIENFETPTTGKNMPWQIDQRQMSLFGAAWTASSFKYLSESGVSSVTYYEISGERGIMMGQQGSRWPEQFFADKNTFFPMFHILAYISQFADAEIMTSISSNPLKVDSLVIKDKNRLQIILVNLNNSPESVCIPELKKSSRILFLDENSFDDAVKNSDWLTVSNWEKIRPSNLGLKIRLKPYSSVFINTQQINID